MPFHGRTAWRRVFVGTSVTALLLSVAPFHAQAQLAETSPVSETVPLQPSLIDFLTGSPVSATMQDLAKPKLLQKAFGGLPKTDPKGLASLIKAKEVDVANRVAAAKYLGKVDCQQFPESQLALKDLLLDEFELVRYEAARSLKRQFSRGPKNGFCLPWSGKSKRKDACRGCCNTENIQEVIDTMFEQSNGQDEYGCPNEPSKRVREVLAEAISLCVQCECEHTTPTYVEPLEPQVEPNVTPESGEGSPTTVKPAIPVPTEGEPKKKDAPKTDADKSASEKPAAKEDDGSAAAAGTDLNLQPAATVETVSESEAPLTLPAPAILSADVSTADADLSPVESSEPAVIPNAPAVLETEPILTVDPPQESEEVEAATPTPDSTDNPSVTPEVIPDIPVPGDAEDTSDDSVSTTSSAAVEESAEEIALTGYEDETRFGTDSGLSEAIGSQSRPLDILKGHCLVALVDSGSYVAASDAIALHYKGRFDSYRLTFSSQAALEKFQANPQKYFPVLDGYCVTTWSRTGRKMRGRYLAAYQGHCYCFALQTWGNEFNRDPERVLQFFRNKLSEVQNAE